MAEAGPDATDAPDRWLRKGSVAPAERMPLLAEAFAAAALHWGESFSALAGSECIMLFKGMRTARVADLPPATEGTPILAALRIPAWEHAPVGLCLDRTMVLTAVEAFFGGGDEGAADDGRPVSPIELRIVDVLGGQAAAALAAGWRDILPTRVEFDRTLPKPDPAFLGKPVVPLLLAEFELKAVGRVVRFAFAFPQAAIDARAALWGDEAAASAPAVNEADWSRQLTTEVTRATLRIDAGIALPPMSLGALASLKVGQVIEMPLDAGANVLLRCGEAGLFRCQLGQSAGFYTVRVDAALDRDPQPPRKGR